MRSASPPRRDRSPLRADCRGGVDMDEMWLAARFGLMDPQAFNAWRAAGEASPVYRDQRSVATPMGRRPLLRAEALDQLRRYLAGELEHEPAHELARASGRRIAVRDNVCQTDNAETVDFCVICMSSLRTYAFAPCGHMCVCQYCSQRSVARSSSAGGSASPASGLKCPLCRKQSSGVYEILPGLESALSRLLGARQKHFKLVNRKAPAPRPTVNMRQLGESVQETVLENTLREVYERTYSSQETSCQSDMCALCNRTAATHAALPCGHLCACADCVEHFAMRSMSVPCPICHHATSEGQSYLKIYH